MTRRNISSGTTWEDRVGYSRAVRVGPHVYVTGTLALDDAGEIVGVDDPYTQASFILRKIERALREAGATLEDVVRTRIYVTDIEQWPGIADAHRERLGEVRPCATMVEVSGLVTPEALVEIEADAYVQEAD